MAANHLDIELKAWRELFDAALRLGLVAKNVEISHNTRDIVLKKQDTRKPVALSIPPHLLIPLDSIDFKNRRVHPFEGDTQEHLAFKNAVLANILNDRRSDPFWSLSAGISVVHLRLQENNLPQLLPKLCEMPQEREAIERKVISARAIGAMDGFPASIVPILDLANHLPGGLPFQRSKSNGTVFVSGITLRDEISLRYGFFDPLMLADDYGFSDASPWAFSLAIKLRARKRMHVSIYRDLASDFIPGRSVPVVAPVENNSTAGGKWDGTLKLDYLPINLGSGCNVIKDQLTDANLELLGPSAPQFFDAMLHSNIKILDAAETLIDDIDVANTARSLLISAVQSQRRAILAFS